MLGEVDAWREFYMERDRQLTKREYLQLMPSTILSTQMQRHGFHGPAHVGHGDVRVRERGDADRQDVARRGRGRPT